MKNLKLPFIKKIEYKQAEQNIDKINTNEKFAKILKNIGNNTKMFREMNKLTRNELSEKSGLSAAYLYSIEKNNQNISATNLEKIAEALGLKMHILLLDNIDAYKILEINNKLKKYSYKELVKIEKLIKEKNIINKDHL